MGAKVAFGLVAQGHIPTIERILKQEYSVQSKYTWEKIGKEIGWCPATACMYYCQYLVNKHEPLEKPQWVIDQEAKLAKFRESNPLN